MASLVMKMMMMMMMMIMMMMTPPVADTKMNLFGIYVFKLLFPKKILAEIT
jgi:hypothetical protein